MASLARRLAARDVQRVARAREPDRATWCAASASRWSTPRATPCRTSIACRPASCEMVRAAGAAEVVSSGELVTRFYASWSDAHLASHRPIGRGRSPTIARDAIALAGERARSARSPPPSTSSCSGSSSGSPAPDSPPITGRACAPARTRPTRTTSRRPSVRARSARAMCCSSTSGRRSRKASGPTRRGWRTSARRPRARQEVWTAVRDARDAAIRLVQSAATERRRCAAPRWTTRRVR